MMRKLLGAHLSVAGGLENALHTARRFDCGCLQIFVKNQRQWRATPLTADQVERFRAAHEQIKSAPLIAHACYLINLASPDETIRQRSVAALAEEADRCDALGVSFLVVHAGAAKGALLKEALRRVARSVTEVEQLRTGRTTMLLLEATAGQGSAVGHRLEHLTAIREAVDAPDRLGFCLDTCHLFAAGYDFRTSKSYASLMDEIDHVIGLSSVKCIHVNDSKRELGSRVDRHEHIGKGKIGKPGFAHFLNDPCWTGTPLILETPKGTDGRGADFDRINLKRLRSLSR